MTLPLAPGALDAKLSALAGEYFPESEERATRAHALARAVHALVQAPAASGVAELEAMRTSRDEYKALASVGTWHNDCRPNRHKAAEEIQKSQQRIDALVDQIAALTAAPAVSGVPTGQLVVDIALGPNRHHHVEAPMGMYPAVVDDILAAVHAAIDKREPRTSGVPAGAAPPAPPTEGAR